MFYGAYVSAAGAMANSYRQDVVANNLANAATVSFKRDLALLQARPVASAEGASRRDTVPMLDGIGGGVFALPTYTDFTPGAIEETQRPFDLALTESGFFRVRRGAETLYTRDGRFTLNAADQLVTEGEGLPVLNDEGEPIVLDRGAAFTITSQGIVSQGEQIVGRISVVDFADTRVLRKQGDNIYRAEGAAQPMEVLGGVKQGYLESSGVNTIQELVAMIQAQRAFGRNATMVSLQDQVLGAAVSRIARLT